MASADFSPFVVTDGLQTLFPSADEISLGTTRHFLSIHLPHLLQLIPSSYWTLTCLAALSLTIASCDFCSSDQRFASTFLQIPLMLIIVIAMNRTPLVLAVSFPLLGRIRDFHPLVTCAARRTKKSPNSFLSGLPRSIINQFRFHDFLCLCLASVHLPHPFHLVFGFQLLGHAVLLCQ